MSSTGYGIEHIAISMESVNDMNFKLDTEKDIPEILALHDRGLMFRAIAKKTFHNVTTVKKVLKANGRI